MPDHDPLHHLEDPARVRTAGRLHRVDDGWHLRNAHDSIALTWSDEPPALESDTLVRLEGRWDGALLHVESHRTVTRAQANSTFERRPEPPDPGEVVDERAKLNRRIRRYFDNRKFREVETPNAVPAPGTDIYLEPVGTRSLEERETRTVEPYLHTSPEFAMKRLLTEGFERIYQIVKVWRDGEVTDLHHPEFTLLEWYRAWESLDAVMEDCERIVAESCDREATVALRTRDGTERRRIPLEPPFPRITMRELIDEAVGLDILECLEFESLRRRIVEREILEGDLDRRHPPEDGRWDDLFFELMVSRIEPHLAEKGAVFVTEWPAPLAILARKSDADPRVAHRFELYVGGVELANGFDELTDADEQRRRFQEELDDRVGMDRPELPMPTTFLRALEYGLPPSSGVALGVDRLLMLALGAARIDDVAPFADAGGLRDT